MKRTADDVRKEVEELCDRAQDLKDASEHLISELANLEDARRPSHPLRRKTDRVGPKTSGRKT